jgi:hypothetical protein
LRPADQVRDGHPATRIERQPDCLWFVPQSPAEERLILTSFASIFVQISRAAAFLANSPTPAADRGRRPDRG